jgi:hypothetical protein
MDGIGVLVLCMLLGGDRSNLYCIWPIICWFRPLRCTPMSRPKHVLITAKMLFCLLSNYLFGVQAFAYESTASPWLNVGFYSAHFQSNLGLRNANPGVGFEYPIAGDWRVTAGRFTNSDDAVSNYVGAYYQPWRWKRWRLGAVTGLFDGYPRAFDGGWFPALLPVATCEGARFGVNVVFVPPIKNRLYGAISFQLKYRVGAP